MKLTRIVPASLFALLATAHVHAAPPKVVKPAVPKNIAAAKKLCDAGDMVGCNKAAEFHLYGENGATEDGALAAEYATKSCDAGNAAGCFWLGRTKSGTDAILLFQKACDGDNAEGCRMSAENYKNGYYISNEELAVKNYGKGHQLYKQACEAGDFQACIDEADMTYYAKDGYTSVVPWEEERATKVFVEGCAKKNERACWLLGHAYEFGNGHLEQNDKKAKAAYDKACKLGNDEGCESRDDLVKERREQGIII